VHKPSLAYHHQSLFLEDAPNDLRSPHYTFRPGIVAEFEERSAKRLLLREKHSKLGAFWHTEFGPLNQVIHVYPYDDLRHRTTVRAALAQDTVWNQLPGGGDLLVAQEAEIMNPAPFMHALGSRDYGTGNVYEMRTYTYAAGDIPKVLDAWAKTIEAREKLSRWRPAGRPSSAGSTSSSIHGFTRISTSAPASARNPGAPGVRGHRRPECGRSGRKTSC
jgi:NIPSNAP